MTAPTPPPDATRYRMPPATPRRRGHAATGFLAGLVLAAFLAAGTALAFLPPAYGGRPDWFRGGPPGAPVLPASVGTVTWGDLVPPETNLVFYDMIASLREMAQALHGPTRSAFYLLRPDHPLNSMEARTHAETTMTDLFDGAAEEAGWQRDDRFRHEGWAFTSTGYEKDGYLFVIAAMGRRVQPGRNGRPVQIGGEVGDWSSPDDALPLAVFTDLPRQDVLRATWLSPESWIRDNRPGASPGGETTLQDYLKQH
ncbi:hypothetical protein [Acuticoccus sediminis]|uniref:hypothetical protein n=1 Tax=Acuticoccus sediminis TaxID=2184697 RepID=UPI001CFF51C3|nr:hypothetical protein [Acuticoccus sediminis]